MFAATARRSSALLQHAYVRHRPAVQLHRALGCLVIAAGIHGQWIDAHALSVLQAGGPGAPAAWSNPHAVFGGLLFACIVARLRGEVRRPLSLADAAVVRRRLSRLVLLLLYGLAGAREVMGLVLHQGRMSGAVATSPTGAAVALPGIDSFQVYLAYGIVALLFIRIQPARAAAGTNSRAS